MTTPKPAHMWAVYGPDGTLLMPTVRHDKESAIHVFLERRLGSWFSFTTQGYSCIRVTVTPDAVR